MMRISIRRVAPSERIIRALGWFIFTASTFFTVFAALFPFDFHFPQHAAWNHIVGKFDRSPYITPQDRLQNILFFVPFGLGLALTIRLRDPRLRAAAQIVGSIVAGFVVSLALEGLQVFLGFRDPTWSDVIMNTLGAVVGATLVAVGGDQLLDPIVQALVTFKPYVTFRNLAVLLAVYVVVQLMLPLMTRNRGSLRNWDNAFPLLIGNETTGDRPWRGRVWQMELASRGVNDSEATQIFHAGTATGVLADTLVGSYVTRGAGPYEDHTGLIAPLKWMGNQPDELTTAPASSTQPAHVNGARWLRTASAIAPATHRIRASSQFTLVTTIQPDEPFQEGPARIVTVSGGVYVRNLSLMQNRYDLSLRLRTPLLGPDGSAPEMVLEQVLDSNRPCQIVLSYKDTRLRLYVDGNPHGTMEITPEAALIWRLYPRVGFKLRLARHGFTSYAAIYRLIVLIPLAALTVGALSLSGWARGIRIMTILAIVSLVIFALELILGSLSPGGFRMTHLLISLIIATCTAGLLEMLVGGRGTAKRARKIVS